MSSKEEQDISTNDSRIVGSAEPLTPEQTEVRLRELEKWGVDLSLTTMSLRLTPTQRVEWAVNLATFIEQLRHGLAAGKATPAANVPTPRTASLEHA